MPATFPYLVQQGHGNGPERGPNDAVEARYKRADLIRRPVVRDEFNNKYHVFESRAELLEWYERVPVAERCCHETVFGWASQRIKFDIDAPSHELDALPEGILEAAIRTSSSTEQDKKLDAEFDELLSEYLIEGDKDAVVLNEDPQQVSRRMKIESVMKLVIEAILDELYVAYYGVEDIYPTKRDLVVTDSSGPTSNGWKFSYHILALPYAVEDNEEAREFTERVLDRLPPPVRKLVDPNVNKKTQNFRMLGSAKTGTKRYKCATSEAAATFGTAQGVGVSDFFVTAASGTRVLPRVYTEAASQESKTNRTALTEKDPVVRAALDLANEKGVTVGHHLSEVRGTLLCFMRDEPSHCRICKETHHNDNSLMISISPVEAGHDGAWPGTGNVECRVVEHCRQVRGSGHTIGEVTMQAEILRLDTGITPRSKKKKPSSARLEEQIASRIGAINAGQVNPHTSLASRFETLPASQKTIYTEDSMRDYELKPTLAVLAQMKLGKTKALRRYIAKHFPSDSIETKVVRFVTFRQTFSRSIAENFPDFTVYNDVQGDLDQIRHPRLIVQAESLHRIKMGTRPEPVDLVVLDEVESILAQFNSGLHKHLNAAFAMFQWMLRTAKHVVCMDANLSDRTYNTLLRMRPAYPPHFHWNQFARAADDNYSFTSDQASWLEKMYSTLREGKRIVLPTNSLTEARTFEEALRREFPTKNVMLYSSETSPSEKARHFGDVHKYWSDLDVLIYTPTCSAGVSYELKHFDTLFGYFCDVSCDVETCRQMLARVRNIGTLEHHICIRATGAALPDTTEEIRRLIYDKRAGLYRQVDDSALQWNYTPDGEIEYYESEYFHLWLETERVNNLSRNRFALRFIDQVADTGANIGVLPKTEMSVGAALLTRHRETQDELKVARCDAVADAAELSPEEAATIRDAFQAQQDVEPTMRLAYEKFQLRESYTWHDRPLDATFVENYQKHSARRVFRNLRRVTEGETILESLQMMRHREVDNYTYMMETRTEAAGYINESRDLLRDKMTYVFQSHFIAIWLLRLCGFVCITDKSHVHESSIEARLRAAVPDILKAIDRIVFEFEIPRPNLKRLARENDRARFVSGMLRMVNAVLRTMYGLLVRRVTKRAGGRAYFLSQNAVGKLFIFSDTPEDDDVDGGPRPHISSNLRQVTLTSNRVNLFLEDEYYCNDRIANDTCNVDDAHVTTNTAKPPEPPVTYGLDDFLAEAFEEVTARAQQE